jgi:activator of HSP90 ATPase
MMTKVIQQSVKFKASPEELFTTYLDPKKHSAATGAPAIMSRKTGGRFKAWGHALSGRNLVIVPNRMIVQAWRANHWKSSDPDSILVLRFSKAPGGGQVELVHTRTSRRTTTKE